MTSIRIQLDEATLERIRRMASAAGMSPEEYVARRVREEVQPKPCPVNAETAGNGLRRSAGALAESWSDEDDCILRDLAEDRTRSSGRDLPE